jgi:mannose-6-phosphate isomerase-like protein (cupin superfamily)
MAIAPSPGSPALPRGGCGGWRQVATHDPVYLAFDRSRGRAGPLSVDEMFEIATRMAVPPALRQGGQRPGRSWELVAAGAHFEAWVIRWPPGGGIELHDHGESAAAIAVRSGDLVETRVVRAATAGVALRSRTLRSGDVTAVDRHQVHDVVNASGVDSTSVHVYSPRLTSMTYYDLAEGELVARHTAPLSLANAPERGPA